MSVIAQTVHVILEPQNEDLDLTEILSPEVVFPILMGNQDILKVIRLYFKKCYLYQLLCYRSSIPTYQRVRKILLASESFCILTTEVVLSIIISSFDQKRFSAQFGQAIDALTHVVNSGQANELLAMFGFDPMLAGPVGGMVY